MGPKKNATASRGKVTKPGTRSGSAAATTVKNGDAKTNTTENATKPTTSSGVNIITEQDILEATSKQQLVEFVNEMTNTKKDQIFEEYKEKVTAQLKNSSSLIQQLNLDAVEKQQTIDRLLRENEQLKQEVNAANEAAEVSKTAFPGSSTDSNRSFELPIRRKQQSRFINEDQLQKELEDIGVFLDLIELLTGIQIVNYEEEKKQFHFDIQQTNSSKSANISYRLIIDKQFKQNAEINYIPTFMEESNARELQAILPEYLCENLSFNLSTLGQFYGKMSKALNKKK
jgi:hypothetical protein